MRSIDLFLLRLNIDFVSLRRGTTTKGNYELKVNRLAEYNPFYYHYSKADQCKVRRRFFFSLSVEVESLFFSL